MTREIFIALSAFAFVSSITPGPNNLMLMASGANFGFRRTVPHMLGIAIGFMVMVLLVGAGLSKLFRAFPAAHLALKTMSVAYLLFLAWKIAQAAPPEPGAEAGHPFTFLQAALFQWVNPKAWAMALTAISTYTPSQQIGAVALTALVFGAINLPSVSSWALLGLKMRRVLSSPARLRLFNAAMALLLAASLVPVLAG